MNLGFSYDARRVRGLAALVGVVLVFGLAAGASGDLPKDRPARNGGRGLAPSTVALQTRMNVNRVIMALTDAAEIGAIPGSVAGGGFWRALTDQYIFSSGVNVGATVAKPGGGLDTLFMLGGPFSELSPGSLVDFQTRAGTTRPGSDLGLFWLSTDPQDFANFPLPCTVDDFRLALFPSLAPFEGLPFPGFADQTICIAGNDVSGAPCSACGGTRLGAETINTYFAFSVPAVQDYFFAILRVFNRSEFVNATNSPANSVFGPYDFNDTVVAIAIDPDLGDAGDDQIGFLPGINTMVWWDSDFEEPDFQFQPPGFGGVTYLKTPEVGGEEVGLANFTVFTNGGARPDPSSRQEWYQALTGDPNFVVDAVSPQDVRGMASSGKFPLPAGEFVEIYAAYFFAEAFGPTPIELTTDTAIIDGEPAVVLFNNFVAAQTGVQSVFDAGFLVPTAPPSPAVELIPGDHQVTVVWDPDPATAINPFASIALDPFLRDDLGNPDPEAPGLGEFLEADQIVFVPALNVPGTTQGFVTAASQGLTGQEVTNPFFRPDFVIQDFQGFRVYRSETGNLDDAELIAQFDLADDIVEGDFCVEGTTVPSPLGPDDELLAVVCTEVQEFPLGTNTGLAFGIVDRGGTFPNPADGPGLINGIPVFYAVTSFSVNCGDFTVANLGREFIPLLDVAPACLTLESGKNLQSATPRSNASSFVAAGAPGLDALQADGSVCDVSEPTATIDLTTGEHLDFMNCSNAVVGANLSQFRDQFQAEVFFVIDSLLDSPLNPYDGGYALAVGHRRVWFHWEDANGNLSTQMSPNMGFYDACYDFTVFCEDQVTAALDTDPSDVGPDASVDVIIATDFSAGDDLVVNGQSLALGQLGGTYLGPVDHAEQDCGGVSCGRALRVEGSSLGTRVIVGNPRGLSNSRAYAGAGPYVMAGETYELTWSVSGGSFSGTLRSLITGNVIPEGGQPKGPANPSTPEDFICGYNWGFIAPGDPAAVRGAMFPTCGPLTNSINLSAGQTFALMVPGQGVFVEGIADLPEDGDVWRIIPVSGWDRGVFFDFGRSPKHFPHPGPWEYNDVNTAFEEGADPGPVDIFRGIVNGYPGAKWRLSLAGGSNELANADLQQILVVPNPFIAANEITRGLGRQRVLFTNLPPQATIRIYTISGNLVRILEHGDGSGTEEWDVRTRFDLLVASGNYYYHVTTPDGRTHLGRFAVIN
ncbi:MAG TPA: hypothetical protein VFH11_09100 [Gemmatimonadota bacterium]|nr:hypothetical protein [Gemmatimonadota bacterium]